MRIAGVRRSAGAQRSAEADVSESRSTVRVAIRSLSSAIAISRLEIAIDSFGSLLRGSLAAAEAVTGAVVWRLEGRRHREKGHRAVCMR